MTPLTSVHAEDDVVSTNTPPQRPIREVSTQMLSVSQQDRLINLTRNVIVRLTAGLDRMDDITHRLETRIEKMKAQGINTTNAELRLTEARENVRKARETLITAGAVAQAIRSNTPRASFETIRASLIQTRDLVRQTHTKLNETLSLLKGGTPENPSLVTAPEETKTEEGVSSSTIITP